MNELEVGRTFPDQSSRKKINLRLRTGCFRCDVSIYEPIESTLLLDFVRGRRIEKRDSDATGAASENAFYR
jgi:hypothetical protein